MERIILRRFQRFSEENNIQRPEQAGFRKFRATEDQIIRMQSDITDGFNVSKKSDRTLLVLIDFSKAFDTVWRSNLIKKLIDSKVPCCMIKWIASYLSDRRASVDLNGTQSKPFLLQAGVLSPNLFTFYINDVLKGMPQDIKASLFADDLALWVRKQDPEACERVMREALKVLENWSKQNKMVINENKCEYLLFTSWNKEIHWRADLRINGNSIEFQRNPTFLGVVFD